MLRPIVGALIMLAPLLAPAAQTPRKKPPTPAAAQTPRKKPPAAAQTRRKEPPKPAENAQPAATMFQIGEIRRVVRGDESPVLHLGMAPSGATVIEFPASDYYFGIHTSDIGDWVRIEKSPSRMTDNHIVLRPGKDLQDSGTPALVEVQMRSGLLINLCIHPTKSAEHQTRRVVVTYNRDEIIAARQRAGLAVNLGQAESEPPAAAPIAGGAPAPQTTEARQPDKEAPGPAVDAPAEPKTDLSLLVAVKQALGKAMSDPQQQFKKWSSKTNGLTVSTRTYDINEEMRIALVAIRNVEDESLRILHGHPELVIETLNDKGKVVELSRVPKRLEETSAKSQVIPGGQTVYYAIAFAPPIMSTKQKLRVTVGQRAAADEPAAVDITARRKEK